MRELTGHQVGHGDQMANRPISSGSGFGGLNDRIRTFNATIVEMPVEAGQDAIPVAANCSSGMPVLRPGPAPTGPTVG